MQATGGTYFFSAILILVGTLNVVYNALLYAFRDFSFLLRLGVLNFVVGVPLQILVSISAAACPMPPSCVVRTA